MSRREGEVILIGEDIEVVIAHIGHSRVRVGIRAPRSTPVVARELKLIRDENLAAAESSSLLSTLDPSRLGPIFDRAGVALLADDEIKRHRSSSSSPGR